MAQQSHGGYSLAQARSLTSLKLAQQPMDAFKVNIMHTLTQVQGPDTQAMEATQGGHCRMPFTTKTASCPARKLPLHAAMSASHTQALDRRHAQAAALQQPPRPCTGAGLQRCVYQSSTNSGRWSSPGTRLAHTNYNQKAETSSKHALRHREPPAAAPALVASSLDGGAHHHWWHLPDLPQTSSWDTAAYWVAACA